MDSRFSTLWAGAKKLWKEQPLRIFIGLLVGTIITVASLIAKAEDVGRILGSAWGAMMAHPVLLSSVISAIMFAWAAYSTGRRMEKETTRGIEAQNHEQQWRQRFAENNQQHAEDMASIKKDILAAWSEDREAMKTTVRRTGHVLLLYAVCEEALKEKQRLDEKADWIAKRLKLKAFDTGDYRGTIKADILRWQGWAKELDDHVVDALSAPCLLFKNVTDTEADKVELEFSDAIPAGHAIFELMVKRYFVQQRHLDAIFPDVFARLIRQRDEAVRQLRS
jgi:hypothetical protein